MLYKYRKYTSVKWKEIFSDGILYFSNPSQFNDPFECKPRIVGLDNVNDRREYANEYISRNHPGIKFKERKKLEINLITHFSNVNGVSNSFHKTLDTYGILSMSEKWDQILMWSHYSDSHAGFCIGIDFQIETDDDFVYGRKVKYQEEYPKISPLDFGKGDIDTDADFYSSTILTKSNHWEYEEEVRFLKLRSEGGSGEYGFNKRKIKELIIGAEMKEEAKNDLLSVVKEFTPWIEIYQAKLSKTSFSIERARRLG